MPRSFSKIFLMFRIFLLIWPKASETTPPPPTLLSSNSDHSGLLHVLVLPPRNGAMESAAITQHFCPLLSPLRGQCVQSIIQCNKSQCAVFNILAITVSLFLTFKILTLSSFASLPLTHFTGTLFYSISSTNYAQTCTCT